MIFTGETITGYLTNLGSPAHCKKITAAAQVVNYYIDFYNPDHVRRLKRHCITLSAILKSNVYYGLSDISHCSITITRKQRQLINFTDCITSNDFKQSDKLAGLIGLSTANELITIDFNKSPHLLIAGSSGSGKSILLNSLLASLLIKASPLDLRLILIDFKRVELSYYRNIPHLLHDVVYTVEDTKKILESVNKLMDDRYKKLESQGLKLSDDFRILIIIDELADLVLSADDILVSYLIRISQLGRAAGIHLVLATQRPTVDTIPGLIKANITARVALTTASVRDSINILDHGGAEKLSGLGDAIYKPSDSIAEIRLQAPYIDNKTIKNIVNSLKM